MYTVLTTKQTSAISDKLAKMETLAGEVRGILDSAVAPASPAVEGKKKPGRPRKVKAEKPATAKDAGILA